MIDPTQRKAKLQRIELLLLDVDGVMTEGGVSWNNQGIEQKFKTVIKKVLPGLFTHDVPIIGKIPMCKLLV